MAYEQIKILELVDRAVNHQWSIPEFQRGFVWKPTQVRDLAESLWYDYPIGSLLVWESHKKVEERAALDAQFPSQWLVDGQQRTTALCILFGRKPYWWESTDEWNNVLRKYDIRFDIDATESPFFWVTNAAIEITKTHRFIRLSDLLKLNPNNENDLKELRDLAKLIKSEGLCKEKDPMEIFTRLERLRKISEKEIVSITLDHELEDIVEIFARLNSKGTRVTEADIYLGYVAARNPGFVRDDFLPFNKELTDYGFDINPNLLFRSIAAVGKGKTRFKDIPDKFWINDEFRIAWHLTKSAWIKLIKFMNDFGILSNEILPTEAALVTIIVMINKFKDELNYRKIMYWLIQASRFSRYSGSSTTSLDEDIHDINDSENLDIAIDKLIKRFRHEDPFILDDFLKDYQDGKFYKFLLYLLVYKNQAQDWDKDSNRIGFSGSELLKDYKPQWHHIFPKKFLEMSKIEENVDAVANIAVIGPTINIKINSKSPLDYIRRFEISEHKLNQQFIDPNFQNLTSKEYLSWIQQRAELLAKASNEFLHSLFTMG